MKNRNLYGLRGRSVKHLSVIVCEALGNGIYNRAAELLAENCAVETNLGQYKDPTPNGAGYGLTQFDKIGFDDVVSRTRPRHKQTVWTKFGYDLGEVRIEDLNDDPVLALIFCRLKYKLIPDIIPEDVISRGAYWKRFYNTSAGKGTVEKYLEKAEKYLYYMN